MMDFSKYSNVKIRLTKLEDTAFDGKHPNGINTGYVREGKINVELSNKHQCFLIIENGRFFNTSQVMKIEEKEGFDLAQTLNSIYKVEILG